MDIQAKIDELNAKYTTFNDERLTLDADIDALRAELRKLKTKRSNLKREIKKLRDEKLIHLSDEVLKVVLTIQANPGINRQKLSEIHPDIENISNALTSARRHFGLIENRGTDTKSSWFDVHAPSVEMPVCTNPDVVRLVEVVRVNPGINKQQLLEMNLGINNIQSTINSTSQYYRLIENRGSRHKPSWFVME